MNDWIACGRENGISGAYIYLLHIIPLVNIFSLTVGSLQIMCLHYAHGSNHWLASQMNTVQTMVGSDGLAMSEALLLNEHADISLSR